MPIEWAIILAVAVSDAILLAETSFRLEASSLLRILAGLIVLSVVLVICRLWKSFPRIVPRLAHLTRTVLVLVLFTNAVSILSFILTGILPLPAWDGALATADRALGLNWLDMYQWLTRHPTIEAGARTVYISLGPETLVLFIALELLGYHNQARAFLLWIIVTTIAALSIGALFPAAGAFVYYHLPVASTTGYVSQWADLRNGTLRTIDALNNQGLVVFPSFHAALAVLCIFAARPLRILKFPLLVLNLLVILASPAMGGHYYIDIFAGIILAALTIRLPEYSLSGIWRRLKKNFLHGDGVRRRFKMMRSGAAGKGWSENRGLARRRRYSLIVQEVAAMPIEWAIILAVAVFDAILLVATSFRLDASSQLTTLAGLIVLAAVFVYCRWRHIPRLAHLACTGLALVLFTNTAELLSFILTGILPLPAWDGALASADRALGLNWLDMYQWLTRHPDIEAFAHTVYMSLGQEMLILLIALELLGHHNQARTFLLWFIVSAMVTVGIGIVFPAAGAFVYYHLPVASTTGYVSQWADLRNGTLRTFNPFDAQGLVVFPSFHTALAVLCIFAAKPLRFLNIPLLILNVLVILATPAMGGTISSISSPALFWLL